MVRCLHTPIVAATCAVPLLAMTPSALAAPGGGAGSCPAPFEAFTQRQLIAYAATADISADSARRTFAFWNRNGDRFICVQSSKAAEKPNLIDNNAR